jgi:integrase
MLSGKLNARRVEGKLAPGYHNDGAGLYLAVGQKSKSWVLRYKFDGRKREMGLGSASDVTLAEARELARQARRRVRIDKVDPIDERRAKEAARRLARATAMTFAEAAEQYIRTHSVKWKNGKSEQQWRNTLATYAHPILGKLPVAEVDLGLIMRVLEPIWLIKSETASRLRGRIERILDWATTLRYRQGENPARWKGHLEHLLPARTAEPEHHAAVPYDQIGAFMTALRSREGVAARALEFLILTAARTSEVIGAPWGEIDRGKRLWTVPPERMKAGEEHSVPLSYAAMMVIEAMFKVRQGDYVFPGAVSDKPLSNMSLLAVLKRMGRGDLTAHGFRSCFRDWAGDCTNFSREICESALAHSLGDKAEKAYRRASAIKKRRRLMEAWAKYCTPPTVPGAESSRSGKTASN